MPGLSKSRGCTKVPPGSKPSAIVVFSLRMASSEPKFSMWAGWTFNRTATSGPSQPRERLDLARVIGADLVDGRSRLARRSCEGERHADVVVQAAGRGERVERRGGECLERGLATAARHRHDRAIDACPAGAAQGPKPVQRVRHAQLGDLGTSATLSVHVAVHKNGDGTVLHGMGHEVVAIPVGPGRRLETGTGVAGQRHEKVARFGQPRVDGNAPHVRSPPRAAN